MEFKYAEDICNRYAQAFDLFHMIELNRNLSYEILIEHSEFLGYSEFVEKETQSPIFNLYPNQREWFKREKTLIYPFQRYTYLELEEGAQYLMEELTEGCELNLNYNPLEEYRINKEQAFKEGTFLQLWNEYQSIFKRRFLDIFGCSSPKDLYVLFNIICKYLIEINFLHDNDVKAKIYVRKYISEAVKTLRFFEFCNRLLNTDLAKYQRLYSPSNANEENVSSNSFKQAHFVRSLNYLLSKLEANNHDKSTTARLAYYMAFGKIPNGRKDFNTLLNSISSKEVKANTLTEMENAIDSFVDTLTNSKK